MRPLSGVLWDTLTLQFKDLRHRSGRKQLRLVFTKPSYAWPSPGKWRNGCWLKNRGFCKGSSSKHLASPPSAVDKCCLLSSFLELGKHVWKHWNVMRVQRTVISKVKSVRALSTDLGQMWCSSPPAPANGPMHLRENNNFCRHSRKPNWPPCFNSDRNHQTLQHNCFLKASLARSYDTCS